MTNTSNILHLDNGLCVIPQVCVEVLNYETGSGLQVEHLMWEQVLQGRLSQANPGFPHGVEDTG